MKNNSDYSDYQSSAVQEENLTGAILSGSIAAIFGAFFWNWFTWFTGAELDYIADVNSLLIGFSIMYFGHAVSPKFGYLGAFLSVLSWLMGRFLNELYFFTYLSKGKLIDWLSSREYGDIWGNFIDSLGFFDLFIVVAAIAIGYHFSFKKI